MTGLTDTDILLDEDWQITRAANGDAPICSGLDCLYQNIALEAVTQKGDVFYDTDFGWSLYDFIQAEDDDLTRMELIQRAQAGLKKREIILPETINISIDHSDDTFRITCSFQFSEESEARQLTVVIDSVSVEVISDD